MDNNHLGPPNSTDEKAPDSSETSLTASPRGAGWPKGKKRQKASKEEKDPHRPISAYQWYIKKNTEKIRAENPNMSFKEMTQQLARDWRQLTPEQKAHYNEAAEEDKERFARELAAYKQSDAYRSFVNKEKTKEKQIAKKAKEEDDPAGFDIPIFTEEFLEHNKVRETELRQLRKSTTDYEQQNAILEKMIENTRTAIGKLEEETVQQRCHNQALQRHLEQMRSSLTDAFADYPLPGETAGPTLATIDSYMTRLYTALTSQSTNSALYKRVRDVVYSLDLQG